MKLNSFCKNPNLVIDNEGENFRGNGFRRCGKIICDNIKLIEHGCASVWYWRNNVKKLEILEGWKF